MTRYRLMLAMDEPKVMDRPAALALDGDTRYVTPRTSGKLAVVDAGHTTARYPDLAEPAPAGHPIPTTCDMCAVHGVAVRPRP
jgi:hypothetical protein